MESYIISSCRVLNETPVPLNKNKQTKIQQKQTTLKNQTKTKQQKKTIPKENHQDKNHTKSTHIPNEDR